MTIDSLISDLEKKDIAVWVEWSPQASIWSLTEGRLLQKPVKTMHHSFRELIAHLEKTLREVYIGPAS